MKPSNEINANVGRAVQPRMSFKEAVGKCFGEYATLSGRARRSEFWWFYLFATLIVAVPLVAMTIVALFFEGKLPVDFEDLSMTVKGIDAVLVVFMTLACLFLLIPSLAVQVRRLHDTGRSGWWVMWGVLSRLPYKITSGYVLGGMADKSSNEIMNLMKGFEVSTVGGSLMLLFSLLSWGMSIVLLIFMLKDSDKGENKYGPSPKYQ